MTTNTRTDHIEHNFSRGADQYNDHAEMQKEIAQILINAIPKSITPNTILEIGCGTGLLTKLIAQKFPNADIIASDISKKMLKKAKKQWQNTTKEPKWTEIDGQNINLDQKFDLIISNMTIQWFKNVNKTYKIWTERLKNNGVIITSRPAETAFWQWKKSLSSNNFESGIINFQTSPKSATSKTIDIQEHNETTWDFLRNLKKTGAATPKENYKSLTPEQIKKTCRYCDKNYNAVISWDVQIDMIKK